MRLGSTWLGCRLVQRRGGRLHLPRGRQRQVEAAVAGHHASFPHAREHNVWFDLETGVCFSAAQHRGGPAGKDYHFLGEPEGFLAGPWGDRFVIGSTFTCDAFRALPAARDREIVSGLPPALRGLEGDSVLVVLGGPSTRRVRWERLHFEHVWSCNQFYLNPRLATLDFDLLALAPDVPLPVNPQLHRYLEEHPAATVMVELERGGPVGRWRPVRELTERYPSRCGYFHTRYQSAIGIGPRLVLLAALLGARQVAVVGLDGITRHGPLHAFEPYKASPGWYRRFGPAMQRRQFVIFWEYLFELRRRLRFSILNLGEVCSLNLSRSITERESPLAPEVRRVLDP